MKTTAFRLGLILGSSRIRLSTRMGNNALADKWGKRTGAVSSPGLKVRGKFCLVNPPEIHFSNHSMSLQINEKRQWASTVARNAPLVQFLRLAAQDSEAVNESNMPTTGRSALQESL